MPPYGKQIDRFCFKYHPLKTGHLAIEMASFIDTIKSKFAPTREHHIMPIMKKLLWSRQWIPLNIIHKTIANKQFISITG